MAYVVSEVCVLDIVRTIFTWIAIGFAVASKTKCGIVCVLICALAYYILSAMIGNIGLLLLAIAIAGIAPILTVMTIGIVHAPAL